MPSYSSKYKTLHDIEWFFECGGYHIHAVSNAGEIPSRIDRDVNTGIQFELEDTPDIIEDESVIVNTEYVRFRLANTGNDRESAYNDYVYGFKTKARKGFYSFDRDITCGENSRRYVLIARPSRKEIWRDMFDMELPRLDGDDIMRGYFIYNYEGKRFISMGFEVL